MEDKLKSLVDQGKTIETISKEMGISLGSVKRKIKSLGLKTKNAIKMRDEYNTTPIEKELLEDLISSGNSLRKISKIIDKSLSSVRYWIKKYNIKLKTKPIQIEPKSRICSKCNLEKSITDFYKRRGRLYNSTYCRECTNSTTIDRMRDFKRKCVEYKGGKCILCGYDKYHGALDFHHLDPDEKDFTISKMKKYSFDDIVRYELDKCVILCANCHREVENGISVVAPPRIELGITD